MKSIHLNLILQPKQDDEAASQSQREAGNIDDGESFVVQQYSPGDFEIVFDHGELSFVF
jgi:hypothetical protein